MDSWKSYLRPFFLKAVLAAELQPAALSSAGWLAGIILITAFLQDQIVSTNLRLVLFLVVGFAGLTGFGVHLVRIVTRFNYLNRQPSALEVEQQIHRFSALEPGAILPLMNQLFRPEPAIPTEQIPFRSPSGREKRQLLPLVISLPVILISIFLFPTGWGDLVNPFGPSGHLTNLKVTALPGDSLIERGDSVSIAVEYSGSPSPLDLIIDMADGSRIRISPEGNNRLEWSKANHQQPLTYHVENAWFRSDTWTIGILDRPFVADWRIKVQPPTYTGQKETSYSGLDGNTIEIPEGSRITLETDISGESVKGFLDGWPGKPALSTGQNRFDLAVNKPIAFRFLLSDSYHLQNRDTSRIMIGILPDEPPVLQVQPVSKLTTADYRIPVALRAADDFGIRSIMAEFRIRSVLDMEEPTFERIILEKVKGRNQSLLEQPVYLSIPGARIFPGDQIEFRIGVNDWYPFLPNGHETWSGLFNSQTPGTDQAFARADSLAENLTETIEETAREARDLNEKIKDVADDIRKKTGKLTFTEENELRQLTTQQQKLSEKMDQLREQADNQFKELNESRILPPETLQKYLELQKLLEETGSEKLQAMMENLAKQMNELDRRDVLRAMESMELNNDAINRQLDKTIETVKRIRLEQSFDEFALKAQEIAREQQQIQAGLQNENQPDAPLEARQSVQTARLEQLKKQLDEITSQAAELKESNIPSEAIEKTKEMMEQQDPASQSRDLQKSIPSGDRKESAQKSKELSKKLESLQQQAESAQKAFKDNQNMIILAMLRRLLTDVTRWSELAAEKPPVKDAKKWGAAFSDQLRQSVQNFQDSARAIATREPQLGLLLNRDLESAVEQLIQAQNAYVNNQVGPGESARSNARVTLNGMVYRILSLMNSQSGNQQGQGQGDGEKSFFDEMRELANRQQNLNQQVLNSGAQSSQSQSGPGKERLAQMAAQQQMIRQQLQQLMQNSQANSPGMSGSMKAVEKEMDEVAKELIKGIDSKLIERQQKILSRMLDSQKSTIEREFEERRESQTNRKPAGMADFDLKNLQNQQSNPEALQKDLNKFKEGYRKILEKYYSDQLN